MPQILGVQNGLLDEEGQIAYQPELLGIMSLSLPQAPYFPNKSFKRDIFLGIKTVR